MNHIEYMKYLNEIQPRELIAPAIYLNKKVAKPKIKPTM
jgi:hypothetical protein